MTHYIEKSDWMIGVCSDIVEIFGKLVFLSNSDIDNCLVNKINSSIKSPLGSGIFYYSLKFDDVISIQGRDEHVDEPQTNENSSRNVFRHCRASKLCIATD